MRGKQPLDYERRVFFGLTIGDIIMTVVVVSAVWIAAACIINAIIDAIGKMP